MTDVFKSFDVFEFLNLAFDKGLIVLNCPYVLLFLIGFVSVVAKEEQNIDRNDHVDLHILNCIR